MFNTNETLNITSQVCVIYLNENWWIKTKCCVRQTDTYDFEFIVSTNGHLKSFETFQRIMVSIKISNSLQYICWCMCNIFGVSKMCIVKIERLLNH